MAESSVGSTPGSRTYDDYPGPKAKYRDFWDPDEQAPADSPYRPFPEYPGLMNRAQIRFQPQGIKVPWFVARGNHDGLVQGNQPANAFFNDRAVGCEKLFPSNSVSGRSSSGSVGALDLAPVEPGRRSRLFAEPLGASPNTSLTPPDPERRFITKAEFKSLQGRGNHQHGFGFVDPAQNRASNGTASYYGFDRGGGMRFISIDSVAEGGVSEGNLDDPQYRWLKRELDRNSSREVLPGGGVALDGDPDRLIVVYGHHTLASMNNPRTDEEAGPCTPANRAGCDADPRISSPIHGGTEGPRNVRDLLLRFPNVVGYVAGHTHQSDATPYRRSGEESGFWEINTPSLIDPAQQLRTVELMDNGDDTLSFFGTILDHSAPVRPPAPGAASRFNPRQMASLSRELSFNDPQTDAQEGLGARIDRNVELLVDDPRAAASRDGSMNGTDGDDVIFGTPGNDVINCGSGNDRVDGGGGNDTIRCGSGDDIVNGGSGDDVIYGGSGNDRLNGGSGNDRIFGESGNDRIDGGPGGDRATGGSGRDTFANVERRRDP